MVDEAVVSHLVTGIAQFKEYLAAKIDFFFGAVLEN